MLGLIISSYGRQFIVEVNQTVYSAVTKGKKTTFVVGDLVQVEIINNDQLLIIDHRPRINIIFRSDHNKSKLIASNIDLLVIVIATQPSFNIHFLDSCLVSAESQKIKPLIVINKEDIASTSHLIQTIHDYYHLQLGYDYISLNATKSADNLLPFLSNKRSLLIGQSGVGKSTITNIIIPHANSRTAVLTKNDKSGCHTTTNATLYHLNPTTSLIDCPGLQEFGLHHLDVQDLPYFFPEFIPFIDQCKFRNCRHLNEPNCGIIQAFHENKIKQTRLTFYQSLLQQLLFKKNY